MRNQKMLKLLIKAVVAGTTVVTLAQKIGLGKSSASIKPEDHTLLTLTDRKSAQAMSVYLRQIKDAGIFIEDFERRTGSSEFLVLGDPLDGTRAFASGLATSTVIAAVFHLVWGRIIACVIGEPATGRIWFASEDQPTEELCGGSKCRVWKGPFDEQASVFFDISHGFKSVLSDGDVARLFALLNNRVKIQIPGSNGLIQALVANGGNRLAGGITTGKGGPWDLAGVYLVHRAGGIVRGFTVDKNRKLIDQQPLNPMDCDLSVYGNSVETVDELVLALQAALSGKIADHLSG